MSYYYGKTVEAAIEEGLKDLGATKEQCNITVIEEPTKGVLGFGGKKAKVLVELKIEDSKRATKFLDGLFDLLKIPASSEVVEDGDNIVINLITTASSTLIGHRGEMLDALQTLAGAVANIGNSEYKRVVVDCENYRENREATLNKLSENLAQKAIRLGKKIKLEPMNPYERRIIHAALSEREGVSTASEGKEPNRYIVIVPDNLEDPDAPAIPARNERGERRGRDNRGRNGRGRERDNRNGRSGKGGFGKKPFNRDRRPSSSGSGGGTSIKRDNDFFGIFLGNSGNSEE